MDLASSKVFGDLLVTNNAKIFKDVSIDGKLGLREHWSSTDITGNAIYNNENNRGFALGNGNQLSTWFSFDGTVRRAIDVYNDGSKMVLHNDVGIGTSSPSSRLDVAGSINITASDVSTGLIISRASIKPTITSGSTGDMLVNYTDGARFRYFGGGATDVFAVETNGNISWSGSLTSGSVPWARLTSVPSTFAPASHDNSAHSTNYEPAFTKLTAFNKNFGTASGTVCQGNDSRLSDSRTPTAHTHAGHDVTVLGNRLSVDSDGKVRANSSSHRRAGMYGVYNSTLIGHIWSMGSAYVIPEDGANFGNLYGLAYKHTNNTTGGTMAGGHQAVWCQNGVPRVAFGTNLWTSGTVTWSGGSSANANTAYTHSQATHAPTNAQANQTISNGNGMNFTGGTGNVTITLGTPSTSTNATTNSVTTSSHTHAITGFALSSHNHDASHINAGTLANARLSGTYNGITLKLNGTNTIISEPNTGTQSAVARSVSHIAEYRSGSSSQTGAIVFIAPNTTSRIMYSLEVVGMIYSGGPQMHFRVQGYRTTGSWSNTSKVNYGIQNPMVRWGVDPTGKNCLIIGDVGTTWSYPHVAIVRAMMSHTGASDTVSSGWTVTTATDLSTYTNVTTALSTSDMSTGITGNAGTATTLATARTINGTSFNGSGNITTANWGTSRNLTIGSTAKAVNGSGNVSWTLAEIGAAATSHGTHVSYSNANPLMNGTASQGTSANLSRQDHVHPVDTSRAASSHGNHVPTTQTASNAVFLRNDNTWQTVTPANISAMATTHAANGITSTNITNWNAAHTHAGSTHAPTNAQANQTISNGNGMNFTGGSGNVTITLGTPGALTNTSTNAVQVSSHTHTLPNQVAGSATTGYITYNGTTTTLAGSFYGGTTEPTTNTAATRLNYQGQFRPARLILPVGTNLWAV